MTLLSGPVVFIDDEIEQGESAAAQLLGAIKDSGRPVMASTTLPSAPQRAAWFQHWQTLSFVIVDWDLSPGSNGALGGSTLSAFKRRELFDFLAALMEEIYCPIFIISREDPGDIERAIVESSRFVDALGGIDARISVHPKEVLMDNIVDILAARVGDSPSLSVLMTWEQEFDRARNRLFIEFDQIAPDWPVYVWRSANDDHVDPAFELSSLIASNLLTRVDPVAFDDGIINSHEGPVTGQGMRKVAHGRTFISAQRLSERMVFPGDVFRLDPKNPDELWINISPVCQTVVRPPKPGEAAEPVVLHLLRGTRQRITGKKSFDSLIQKGKGPKGEVIHTLEQEDPFYFEFGKAQLVQWESVREFRSGRVLPPYVTRLQQKHAAYLQSEGLPRVDYSLYES